MELMHFSQAVGHTARELGLLNIHALQVGTYLMVSGDDGDASGGQLQYLESLVSSNFENFTRSAHKNKSQNEYRDIHNNLMHSEISCYMVFKAFCPYRTSTLVMSSW